MFKGRKTNNTLTSPAPGKLLANTKNENP